MEGIQSEQETSRPTGQPAHVLAAWIRELLDDVREAQVERFRVLRARLQSDAFEWDNALLAQAISTVHSAGREMQARDLNQGWLARLLGRQQGARARFVAAHERIVGCAARLKMEASELAGHFKTHHSGARRVLVELEMECNALQGEVDQGVGWLQEMCSQLARMRIDDDPAMVELAEAAHGFTAQFKWLQSLAAMIRDIGVRGQNVLERRSALLEQVRADIDGFDKVWMRAVGKTLADVRAGRSAGPSLPAVATAHDELMRRLDASSDACTALQQEEHLMGQHLDLLRKELETPR